MERLKSPIKRPLDVKMPKPLKSEGLSLYRSVNQNVVKELQSEIATLLLLLKMRQDEYVTDARRFIKDGIGLDIITAFRAIRGKITPEFLSMRIGGIVTPEINKANRVSREKFEQQIKKSVGIDISGILAEEGITDFLETEISKNVSLISSASMEYLKNVETSIITGVNRGLRYEEIAKQITGKNGADGKLKRKIQLIARNEMANVNSQLNKKRSENLGITKFKWISADDERVRGNPNGLYPNARPSHWHLDYKRSGKLFEWKKGAPSKDGPIWPGSAVLCRCTSANILEP